MLEIANEIYKLTIQYHNQIQFVYDVITALMVIGIIRSIAKAVLSK